MSHDGYKVFDCDMHMVEPWDLWLRYIEPKYKDRAPVGTTTLFMDSHLMHDGKVICPPGMPFEKLDQDMVPAKHGQLEAFKALDERGWGPDTQVEAMDIEGIDAAVLFPSRGLYAHAKIYDDDGLAAAISRAYNNWLAEFCAYAPDRMYGAGLIPAQDVYASVQEVRRMKEELGFKAIFLRPNPVQGRNWHRPVYDPLWAECEKQGVVVGFHEGWPCDLPEAVAERFDIEQDDHWLTQHVACHPVEMMYASLSMITGGVLERFPELKVAFLEANCSWVPYWLWRMDEHYEHRERQLRDKLPLLPSEYFKRQCWASIEADESLGKHVIEWMGDENIVFSTDYPHEDSPYPKAVETFMSQPFPAPSKKRILWDNSARLYGME